MFLKWLVRELRV